MSLSRRSRRAARAWRTSSDRRLSAAWQDAMSRAAARTRLLFGAGRHVCDGVGGRLRVELRLTWLGGMRILEHVEHAGFDVFTRRPAIGLADAPALLWRALVWRKG